MNKEVDILSSSFILHILHYILKLCKCRCLQFSCGRICLQNWIKIAAACV